MKAKRIISSGLATALAVAMAMPAGAFAVNGNDSVIDTSKKGSMTIHKLIENDGKDIISDGHEAESASKVQPGADDHSAGATENHAQTQTDGTITATDPFNPETDERFNGTEDYTEAQGAKRGEGENKGYTQNEDGTITVEDDSWLPLDDIGFSYLKIADIEQVNAYKKNGNGFDATPSVGTYYKSTDVTRALITLGASVGVSAPEVTRFADKETSSATAVERNQDYFTTAALEKWLAEFNALTATTKTQDGKTVYSTRVSGATREDHAAGEEILRAYLKENKNGEKFTDDAGSTGKIENLELGLYLVGETNIAAHDGLDADGNQYIVTDYKLNPEYPVVESEAAPFFVSLPTTNVAKVNGNDAGTAWEYDIDVYPKDQTNSILKRIVDPDENGDRSLRIREDYQIGDVIEQVIYADAPALQKYTPTDILKDQETNGVDTPTEPLDESDTYAIEVDPSSKKHEKFVIKDTMSASLTFVQDVQAQKGVTEVFIIPKSVNPQYDTQLKDVSGKVALTYDADYQVTTETLEGGDHTFEVALTASGLDKLDKMGVDSQVVVFFNATLNKDAQIGVGDANVNHPNLTWKNTNTAEKSVDGNYVYDYTYELDLKKTGVEDATRVIFTVSHTDDNNHTVDKSASDPHSAAATEATLDIKFVEEEPGVYHVFDPSSDGSDAGYVATVNGETYTNAVRPAQDGKLIIKGFDSDKYTFKEIATENGKNLLKSTFMVEFVEDGDPKFTYKQQENGPYTDRNGVKYEGDYSRLQDGSLIRATLTSENDTTDLALQEGNFGIANVQIDNYKAVTLRTGGEGRTMLYLGGAAMLGLLSVAVIADKKRKASR